MKVLGISAYYHDSAASLLIDGRIVCAAQEERFSRIKNDPSFPQKAVSFCLKEGGLRLQDLDAIVYYEKPFLKLERILDTYLANAPRGFRSFIYSMPKWISDKLFFKRKLRRDLLTLEPKAKIPKLFFVDHHLSHAAFSFFTSPFEEAAILSVDAVGEWETTAIYYASGNRIRKVAIQGFPHSIGLLYSSFTYFLGFKVNSGEYKLMGLSAYGNEKSERYRRFTEIIERNLVKINEDGSINLTRNLFSFSETLEMINGKKWEALFGLKQRQEGAPIEQGHCDLALAIQRITERIMIQLGATAKKLTGSKNLCITGGVALNCLANGKIVRDRSFKNVYVPFSPGDSGSAIGAPLAFNYIGLSNRWMPQRSFHTPFLGKQYTNDEVLAALNEAGLLGERLPFSEMTKMVAGQLKRNKIVGWFQGRFEFGPRALGNRSILANPEGEDVQFRINGGVKFREHFRPFAPVVLEEYLTKNFDLEVRSPYMQFIAPIQRDQQQIPADFVEWNMDAKLQWKKSRFPAITHVDFTARVQTLSSTDNQRLRSLVEEFYRLTGCPMLLNTSFNVRGEPIVNSPKEAVDCYLKNNLDILVMNDYVICK